MGVCVLCLLRRGGGWFHHNILLLSDPPPYFVETVRDDDTHPQEVVDGAETPGWNVALEIDREEPLCVSPFCSCVCVLQLFGGGLVYFILYRFIAAGGR